MKRLNSREEIWNLLTAPSYSAALGTAIETGLLWMLAEEPLTGEAVAQKLHIPEKRCHYWLQVLQALGILDQSPNGYLPSSLAIEEIVNYRSRESWQHLVLDERERSEGVHNLALYIGVPGSVWVAQGLTAPRNYVEKMRRDPLRAREFTRMLYEVHQYLGKELAELLDLTGVQRIMDVGGNSGVVSIALLRKYPHLTAVVIDLENVCIAGREIVEENSLADRITYQAVEFDTDEFPDGFDMLLVCDVSIYDATFLRKLWDSLNPGGRLVVVDHFSPEENTPPVKLLEWSFLDSLEDSEFRIMTLAQVQRRLVEAGFQPLPGEHLLPDRRIVIQAVK